MQFANRFRISLTQTRLVSFFSVISLLCALIVFSQFGQAQTQPAQLSLADVLIGLRSKKVPLGERNRLLSDAVKVRGITFSLTPEIETELVGTGANADLVGAIQQKSVNVKISAVTAPVSVPAVAAPAVPVLDFAFYQTRADEHGGKGEYELAVKDYSRAIELDSRNSGAYLKRGQAFANNKSYDLAMLDYDKTLELSPKESAAYFNRGGIHEKRGNLESAMQDYQKAIEFDGGNEAAKSGLKRLQDESAKTEQLRIEREKIEQAKVSARQKESEAVLAAQKLKAEESSETMNTAKLGSLVAQAVKMIMPIYPPVARKSNITGQVMVQIAFDENGSVTSAKAANGPPMLRAASEDAARRTKFKSAMIGDKPVKATGFIVYNFTVN